VPDEGGATGPAGGNGPSRGASWSPAAPAAGGAGCPAGSLGRLTGVPYTEPPARFGGGGGGTDARARTGVDGEPVPGVESAWSAGGCGHGWFAGGPDGWADSPDS
jgi:hypothetical protein